MTKKCSSLNVKIINAIVVDMPKKPSSETLDYAAKVLYNILGKDAIKDIVNYHYSSSTFKRITLSDEEIVGCLHLIFMYLEDFANQFLFSLQCLVLLNKN